MARFIQLLLAILFLISLMIFYKIYISDKKFEKEVNSQINSTKNLEDKKVQKNSNSWIENLNYEINIDNKYKYTIFSKLSELSYNQDNEVINMQDVTAIFYNKEDIPFKIKSDQAIYNSLNYSTLFKENVQIEFLDNKVLANKMNVDFKTNLIRISDNVRFNNNYGFAETDNVEINMITKKIKLFMNSKNKDVKVLKSEDKK